MPSFKRLNVLLILIVCCFSCGRSLPTLDGINLDVWKNDKNGCKGQRAAVLDALQQQRTKLQGLTEMQIIDLLGRPDQNELYSRNQKFFYWFVQPGATCEPADSSALRLTVRFNATGLSKEITIE